MMQQWLSRFPRVNRKNKLYSTGSEIHFDLTSAVTGSIDNGRYLAIWENMAGGFNGDDYNVRGQRFLKGFPAGGYQIRKRPFRVETAVYPTN